MTSSFTQSDRPIDRARRAMRIASSAVRQPAVLGRMRYRFQSMTSRRVFFLGSSRSRRLSATVTSSHPDAVSAASMVSSSAYLPVPRERRDRSSTPAMTRRSVARVGQPLDCIGHRQPGQLVDLNSRLEASALGLHEPVAGDLVAAAAIDIRGAPQWPLDLAAKPCLFADLAQRAVLRSLVRLDLAFGQSPVVVLGAVDDRELCLA